MNKEITITKEQFAQTCADAITNLTNTAGEKNLKNAGLGLALFGALLGAKLATELFDKDEEKNEITITKEQFMESLHHVQTKFKKSEEGSPDLEVGLLLMGALVGVEIATLLFDKKEADEESLTTPTEEGEKHE